MRRNQRKSTLDSTAGAVIGADAQPRADHEHPDVPALAQDAPLDVVDVPEVPDGLPAKGSACRFCGVRAPADARRIGGPVPIGEYDTPPPGAVVRARNAERTRIDRIYQRPPRRVRYAITDVWRVCAACVELGTDDSPVKLLGAALGEVLPNDPTHIRVAADFAPVAYWELAGSTPADPGRRRGWRDVDTEPARRALAELSSAGGIPHPSGKPCAICGRTNSPYGWREEKWRPPGNDRETPTALPVCGGVRQVEQPNSPRWMRWQTVSTGCEVLLNTHRHGLAAPLEELACKAAFRAGIVPDGHYFHLENTRRALAWTHPDYETRGDVREPWWHLPDAPLHPPTEQAVLAERLAALENKLAAVGGGARDYPRP